MTLFLCERFIPLDVPVCLCVCVSVSVSVLGLSLTKGNRSFFFLRGSFLLFRYALSPLKPAKKTVPSQNSPFKVKLPDTLLFLMGSLLRLLQGWQSQKAGSLFPATNQRVTLRMVEK